MGTSVTVSCGLKLIGEGFLDDMTVDDLAVKLGMGARHLRRLFMEHLGASPKTVATTRRAHFAKQLIESTELSMTKIAYSAGFSSVRRFNAAVKKSFDRIPSEIRRNHARRASHLATSAIELRLPFRSPFDWTSLLVFLRDRATPSVEAIVGNTYHRTIELNGNTGTITVELCSEKKQLLLKVAYPNPRELLGIVERVRRLFDLAADPDQIENALSSDPAMSRRVKRFPGLRVPGAWDGFELSVRAILGQQVSVKGATTLAGRIADRFGKKTNDAAHEEKLSRIFPSAEKLAEADIASIGLPKTRAEAIRTLARKVADGDICFEYVSNTLDFKNSLTAVAGIGAWTANYIAMRAIRDPDAFPADDLVLRKVLSNSGQPLTTKQILDQPKQWQPWRTYAAMYLWRTSGD
jgi:AraC family transcriptional regulator of adaptative response / DNA-3-methyladenine glycosylase II